MTPRQTPRLSPLLNPRKGVTTKGNDAGSGEGGMKRFLIFICLFPGIAVAVFLAFVSIGVGAFPDNPQAVVLVGWGYVVGVIPALICAVVDLLLRKTRIPPVIGTALVGYGIATLPALTIFDWDLGMALAFGLVGGIPAAVCSWLSGKIK
jgi:hypothetical protein